MKWKLQGKIIEPRVCYGFYIIYEGVADGFKVHMPLQKVGTESDFTVLMTDGKVHYAKLLKD